MKDLIGRTIGHYRVVEQIGAGGMGVVYRAHDERLDRDVAIKVLPEDVAENTDRLARFEREARAVAKLAHPNILAIHDFGIENGLTFAVTELLEGESLRERIPSGGLGWQKATEIGAAVAEGLAAAHGKGVIHRDLKPENVFVTADGRVKILDFGLAQIKEPVEDEAETATLTPAGTAAGTVMGTLGYMSPEQLRGEPADGRSDIFALGCVLYEMVAGKAVFLRPTTAETTAAILKEEPPSLSDAGTSVPAELERTIRRCLEKSPEARFQSSSDLAYNLRSITTDHAVQVITPTAVTPVRLRRRAMWIAAGVVIVAVAALLGWIIRSSSTPDLPPATSAPLTSFPGDELFPAISPDGTMVAYVRPTAADFSDLYVTLVGEGEPLLLSDGTSHWLSPAWSPDGRQIAFGRAARNEDGGYTVTVESVAALGGQKRLISTTLARASDGLSWSPDGATLAMVDRESPHAPGAIYLLSLETGEKRGLTVPPADHYGDRNPRFSPDGRMVAFVRWGTLYSSDIYLTPSEGGEPRRITTDIGITRGFDWAADGKSLVFSASRAGRAHWISLWRISVDGGEPEPLGVGDQGTWPSISREGGRLCYVKDDDRIDIWRVGGPASTEDARRATKFISSTRYENFAQYSPDGQQILFGSYRSGADEIWICDSDGSNPRQLTRRGKPGGAMAGAWSPDGEQVAFSGVEDGTWEVFVVQTAGGIPRRLTSGPSNDGYASWSRDGRFIYFGSDRTGRLEVFRIPAAGGEPQQITEEGGAYAVESPDGRDLYFTIWGLEGGLPGIWRMPVGGGEAMKIHDFGGFLGFEVLEDGICVVNRDSQPPSVDYLDLHSGKTRQIAALDVRPGRMGFSISPDQRWILFQGWEDESDLMLVENFR
jgi:Tol biopolymer transport system component/serine/threonine protein kinase